MDTQPFRIVALTPAGEVAPELVIAADRAGCLGIVNAEIGPVPKAALQALAGRTRQSFGLKLPALDQSSLDLVTELAATGLGWLVLDAAYVLAAPEMMVRLAELGIRVVVEITEWDDRFVDFSGPAALLVKGHEAGGRVGEETSFILLQKALRRQGMPVWVRGGIGMHSAAAVRAVGGAAVVLDDQLLLLRESSVAPMLRSQLANFTGLETGLVAAGGGNWRIFEKPGFRHVRQLKGKLASMPAAAALGELIDNFGWRDPDRQILPLGQAAAFAAAFAERYATFGRLAHAMLDESGRRLERTVALDPLGAGQGVAAAHETTFPIVQGPMTRVSDVAGFAQSVAEAGALPMLALALMRPEQVDVLLAETTARLAGKPWGVGLLGFAPAELIHAQIEIARKYAPRFALIAGGRPDQAKSLEEEGVTSYLHVPSPRLLTLFLEQGARRFVFEGRECGGHVGPLSSFVLWDTMVSTLLATVRDAAQAAEIQVLFAGGVHDALSAAMVATIAEPLAERGVKVGVLAGTAYLFTREIVGNRAVVPGFQQAALGCSTTVTLETGPGHASRAAQSPFAEDFLARRRELETAGRSGDEIRQELEAFSLGRLRVASKGQERQGPDGRLRNVPSARQAAEGMYMLGQVATLRQEVVSLAELHREISEESHVLLAEQVRRERREPVARASRPADIAVIGLGALLPGAQDVAELWENILDRHNAITEIPRHRWDWRLYFDEDRSKPDKIYSRWGGFLDDLLFDPLRYGIPPRAIEALDPLQLMTLEVVGRCIADAGLEGIDASRERMSIIIGASGGAGDVGAQYAVRAELPRFTGDLDPAAADRLPKWTEDSFAGILLNVAAGRAANRFDMGGVNFTVDAACASSLAAVYQAVLELETGRSDLVITGGVDTVQGPFGYLCFSKTQALSPQGRCRTFDTSADEIVISEGLAMLALKRLADAERDGDRVYAVIKGIGGSSDGRAKSMTAPHPDGQIRALTRAYEMAGYSPATVGLFEAHGTGTVAGDTAELETVTRLLRQTGATPHGHAIGSVKTLIGHTKATAGAAGLVKAVLALHHKVLPPHGDVDAPNHKLTEPSSPLFLLKEPRPWIGNGMHPRRSAVSAFGFGGTNFHVALEEYDAGAADAPRSRWPKELLVWRGPDRAAVAAAIRETMEAVAAGASPELRDLAVTLASRAPSVGLTATLVVRRDEPLAERFLALAAAIESSGSKLPPGAAFSDKPLLRSGGKLAIIFPGQGSQYPEMLRDVAVAFPEMRAVLERADRVLTDHMRDKGIEGGALSRAIYPAGAYDGAALKAAAETLTRTDVAQPALGAIEAGLLRVLRSLDVAPEMAAGHSYGEFVALHAAGVLDLDELLLVSEARGRFMVEAAADGDLGTMAAVRAERATVEAAIAGIPDICVANHNTPSQSVLSGAKKAVEEAIAALTAAGMSCQRLSVGAAFHSHIVAPARDRLAAFIAELPMRPAAVPVFGNTSAAAYPIDPDGIRALLAGQLGRPVEFVREIEGMHDAGARVFLSIGPKGAHAGMVREILGDRPHSAVACDDGEGGLGGLLAALGMLLAEGAALNLTRLWAGRDCRVLNVDLAGAGRRPEPQPHMWYLNGGGAHRVGVAPRKPLMIEDVASLRPSAPATAVAKAPHPEPAQRPAVPVAAAPAMNGAARSLPQEVRQMDSDEDHYTASQGPARGPELIAVGDREATLAEFQVTMQRFLETQQNVMLAYLSAAAPSQRPPRVALEAPRQRLLAQRSSQITVMPPAQMPAPAAHVNGSAAVAKAVPAPVFARNNGASALPPVNGSAAGSQAIAVPMKNGGNGVAPPAPATLKPPANGANGHGEFGKPALTNLLLGLVEERTGYPRDMLGMDQNLEADLGIDSIKRVEIVGALLKALPPSAQSGAAGFGESLNGQKTLNGIIDLVCQQVASAAGEAAPRPFDLAGTDIAANAACARPPRFVMAAHKEEFPAGTVPETLPAGLYLLTDDATGVARALAGRIEQAGGTARILDPEVEPALSEQQVGLSPVGLIHLAPLGAKPLTGSNPSDWRSQAQRYESQPHQLLRKFAATLAESGRVIIAAGLGGRFGRGASASGGVSVQGGGPGLVKCLREEWPGVIAKAVDLDPTRSAEDNAGHLFEELAIAGGRMEVGYPGGSRTVFRTEPAELDPSLPPRDALSAGAVVLATGGARGITAEVVRLIARPGVTLILAGRSPLPGAEDVRFGAIPAGMLRGELIKAAREGGAIPTPAAIERQLQARLRDREIRANLRDFAAAGARIVYRPIDIADPVQTAALVVAIYDEFGRLDGVIHGAGILEDKLVVDKDAASWSRVVETKALSAFMLSRSVRPETLRFFIMFGSVAGRYGNSGQSDYATANELLNRLAWHLRGEWPDTVKIAVLNWGPWAGTRHGPGMVSGETRRKFEAKQVTLVEPEGGAQACLDEILRGPLQDVEVVLGGGPWESEEARRGRLPERASEAPGAKPASQRAPVWPLLRRAVSESGARGGRRLVTTLSVDDDLYLDQHRLDGVAVLPAAAALELAAEAAATIWPGWVVSEVSNLRLLNGFKLDEGDFRALEINVLGSEHGDAGGFSASVELRSTGDGGRLHYRASVKLSDALPQEPAPGWARGFSPAPAPLSAREAYRDFLFHGPCLQAMTRLVGLDETGAIAEVVPGDPSLFHRLAAPRSDWLFDPALLDAAAQLAWVWSCQFRGMAALPNSFGRVSRFAGAGPAYRMLFVVEPGLPQHQVRADVLIVDEGGRPVLAIEALESTANAGLNRFRGWSGEIRA